MDHKVRAKQVEKIKEQTIRNSQPDDITIFGGDCNFGFPGERSRAEKILAPQFVCATSAIGPTLDGRYSENVPHLPNRIAKLLSFFGIATKLCTDHFFVNSGDKRTENLKVRVLPDRVSDHSPLELVF
jgi:endonuclease/exonuclease/phosphatase (EEP) superfamily protein YafD